MRAKNLKFISIEMLQHRIKQNGALIVKKQVDKSG